MLSGHFQSTLCVGFCYNANWTLRRRDCINLRVLKAENVQNAFGHVKASKTSLSARINFWINPGFLMQSGALAIPSAEHWLLDELSKPRRLKEINWIPPPSSIFFLCPFKHWSTPWDGGTLMCEIDSSRGHWSLAVSCWDLRLNPPPDSQGREGADKAHSLGREGERRGRGRSRWVYWQQLHICGDLGDDFISNSWLSSNGYRGLREGQTQL